MASSSPTIVCSAVTCASTTARFWAAAASFSKDIPPFVIAAERNLVFGLNVVGLRRAGISPRDRREVKRAFKLVYLSGLNVAQAREKAAGLDFNPLAREFLDFIARAKKRGVCPLKRTAGSVEL